MITPTELTAQARQWLGVPFLHQGRTRFGADCLGYLSALLAELGDATFLDYLPKTYGRGPQRLLLEGLTALTYQRALEAGTLVLIQWPMTEHASHAGLYTGESLIHCTEENGRVVEHGYREPWMRRTVSVWALPGVTYQ